MVVRGIVKGDRIPIDLYFGTDKKCKSWISERDLNMFTSLSICDNDGKETLKIK